MPPKRGMLSQVLVVNSPWLAVAGVITLYYSRSHSTTYLLGAAGVYALFFGFRNRMEQLWRLRPPFTALGAFVFVSTIVIVKYFWFQDCGDVDFACYTSALWNTLHGRLLWQSFLGQPFLAMHPSYTLLAFVPVYALGGNIGLIVVQSLLWLSGIVLLCRMIAGTGSIPLVLLAACAGSPALLPIPFFGFHVDVLFVPLAALALYAYKERKYRWFAIAVLLLPMVKETFALASFLFGVIALIERRSKKWILLPVISSIVLDLFWLTIISPLLRTTETHGFRSMLPLSLGEAVGNLLRPGALHYALLALLTFWPIIQAGKKRWLLFPAAFLLFNMTVTSPAFLDFWRHYAIPLGTVAWFPLAFAPREKVVKSGYIMLLVALISWPAWRDVVVVRPPNLSLIKQENAALGMVPDKASCVAHSRSMARWADRPTVAIWMYRPGNWGDFDYLYFDKSYRPGWWAEGAGLEHITDSLRTSDGWEGVFGTEEVLLLKNRRAAR